MRLKKGFFAIALGLFASMAVADVPPPPLAPEAASIATGIARAVETNNPQAYEQFLASDLEVWLNGKKISSSRIEWLNRFKPQLSARGVKYRVDRVLAGNQNFMLVLHYDSRGSFEPGHQECCEFFEVSQYEVKDGRVSLIRVLSTGNTDLTSAGFMPER